MKKLLLILLSVVIIGVISAGGALAYRHFTANVSATVSEPISWSCIAGDGVWDSGTWTVSLYPAESKSLTLRFFNLSSVDIIQTVAHNNPYGNISLSGGGVYTVPGSGFVDVTFLLTTNQSLSPGTYSYVINVDR